MLANVKALQHFNTESWDTVKYFNEKSSDKTDINANLGIEKLWNFEEKYKTKFLSMNICYKYRVSPISAWFTFLC